MRRRASPQPTGPRQVCLPPAGTGATYQPGSTMGPGRLPSHFGRQMVTAPTCAP